MVAILRFATDFLRSSKSFLCLHIPQRKYHQMYRISCKTKAILTPFLTLWLLEVSKLEREIDLCWNRAVRKYLNALEFLLPRKLPSLKQYSRSTPNDWHHSRAPAFTRNRTGSNFKLEGNLIRTCSSLKSIMKFARCQRQNSNWRIPSSALSSTSRKILVTINVPPHRCKTKGACSWNMKPIRYEKKRNFPNLAFVKWGAVRALPLTPIVHSSRKWVRKFFEVEIIQFHFACSMFGWVFNGNSSHGAEIRQKVYVLVLSLRSPERSSSMTPFFACKWNSFVTEWKLQANEKQTSHGKKESSPPDSYRISC